MTKLGRATGRPGDPGCPGAAVGAVAAAPAKHRGLSWCGASATEWQINIEHSPIMDSKQVGLLVCEAITITCEFVEGVSGNLHDQDNHRAAQT
jgi:hypothetical protein